MDEKMYTSFILCVPFPAKHIQLPNDKRVLLLGDLFEQSAYTIKSLPICLFHTCENVP